MIEWRKAVLLIVITLVPKPWKIMASGGGHGLALPEPLQDEGARSWFKRFEVCAAANE